MLHTIPDVVGPGTFNLADLAKDNGFGAPYTARAVQVVVLGAGTVRLGEAENVSTTRGLPMGTPFGSQLLPYVGENCLWNLGGLAVYVPAGATACIAWEY
jgi:hypothetical protein